LACIGDRCWDLGTAFGSYLATWLFSIPMTGQDPPDRFLDLARHPLDRVQPSIDRLWRDYCRDIRLSGQQHDVVLEKSVRYAGAYLIQIAFERLQHLSELPGTVVAILQLSMNILMRPREAAVQLMGLRPLGGPRSPGP